MVVARCVLFEISLGVLARKERILDFPHGSLGADRKFEILALHGSRWLQSVAHQ